MSTPPTPAFTKPPTLALAAALQQLQREGRVDIGDLLDDYVACRPAGHPGVSEHLPDTRFLAHALSLGGPALLEARHWVLSTAPARTGVRVAFTHAPGIVQLRLPSATDALGDALAWCLGIACEARKLMRLVPSAGTDLPWSMLLASCADCGVDAYAARLLDAPGPPNGGKERLDASLHALYRGGTERTLLLGELARIRGTGLDGLTLAHAVEGPGPIFVVAGATERLHDVVSPYLRRLAPRMEAMLADLPASADAGPPAGPDAGYEALSWLFAEAPETVAERSEVERQDGLVPIGDIAVVRFESIAVGLADPRAQAALDALNRGRARALICPRDGERLTEVLRMLGDRCHSVWLLSEGFLADGALAFPRMLEHQVSGHICLLPEARDASAAEGGPRLCTSSPSLGLSPADAPCGDALLFPLANAALRACAEGSLPERTRIRAGLCRVGDGPAASALSLHVLADMAKHTQAAPGRRAMSPLATRLRG